MMNSSKSRQLRKYFSLGAGILGWFLGGVVFGFNVYAISLKQTFNYTQTELDYIASSGDWGECFQFPAGIVIDKFGPKVTCSISLIVTTMGFLLMWMATAFRIFFSSKSWLVCAFYFLTGFGPTFLVIPSMVVNCKNFDKKHLGKVLSLLSGTFGVSPAIIIVLYEGLFVQGHFEDAENQKLGEFMMMLAVLSACISVFCVVMLKTVPEDTPYDVIEQSGEAMNKTNDIHKNKNMEIHKNINDRTALVPEKTTKQIPKDMNCWQIIKTPQFYYVFLICLIIMGICISVVNNLTIIVESAQIDVNQITFTLIIPIFAVISRLFVGVLPDYIFQKWPFIPKSSILLFSCILTCISQMIFIVFNGSLIGLICASVMVALAYGVLFVHISIITINLFGLQYCGQNCGLVFLSNGFGLVLFQKLFALNYETNSPPGSHSCFGDLCTKWFFVLTSSLSFCAVFLNFCLMKIERDLHLQHDESQASSHQK
ncbi:unnamed protein product [Owenia fusiformis]|uniref:Uncharacterized protein n=1 Tax=Owenia fusiformis TaxID=6347 RepID=A0A8S4NS16_OWEFU|nr:unnamed protein product [Owenia fusiformis]